MAGMLKPSMPNPKGSDDPHDIIVVPADAVRVAPDVVAPSDDEISDLLRAAARHRAGPAAEATVPSVDTRFRPTAVDDLVPRPRPGRKLALRFLAALALAIGSGVAAIGWEMYGDQAKQTISAWAPQLASLLPTPDKSPSASPPVEPVAADAVVPQVPPAAAATPADGAAVQDAVTSADTAQMARDLASMGQQVEQLKATIAELKAGQQQMARDLAKATELNARSKLALVPPRPPVVRPRKPDPAYAPTPTSLPPAPAVPAGPQAVQSQPTQLYPAPPAVQPAAATQLPPAPGFTSAPRPPMPVQ
jgi:hypothetical protein